jgi:hypothetical protein
MKEIKAKYGRYDFHDGNNIFYLTEEKVINTKLYFTIRCKYYN